MPFVGLPSVTRVHAIVSPCANTTDSVVTVFVVSPVFKVIERTGCESGIAPANPLCILKVIESFDPRVPVKFIVKVYTITA